MNELLSSLYHGRIANAAMYSGANQLLRVARQHNSAISMDDVVKYLRSEDSHTKHLMVRRKFSRQKTVASNLFSDLQLDLADMGSEFSKGTRRKRYMLVLICVLSRRLFTAVGANLYDLLSYNKLNYLLGSQSQDRRGSD